MDEIDRKMGTIDLLRAAVLALPVKKKKLSKGERNAVNEKLSEAVKCLTGDKDIDVATCDPEDYEENPRLQIEVTEAQIIVKDINKGQKSPKDLAELIEDLITEISKDVEAERENLNTRLMDGIERKLHFAEILKDELDHIQTQKKDIRGPQRKQISTSCEGVIEDIVDDEDFCDEDVTAKRLKKKKVTPDEKEECLMLGKIMEDLDKTKVDPKKIASQLEAVIEHFRNSVNSMKEENNAKQGNDTKKRLQDADLLEEMAKKID